ncbi:MULTISPECIES: lasso peptide biosynthesis PqqD family chaperone [Amycolatopsis]|uniref:Lasso peptide biosynthesis PqqD family chaperone n=1 Tax=Amycolatopsis dendrobii TaxID=2760662 RepID=A0A7W3VT43_9PSEU|nr:MULTISPECIES: lasso peptide biosynthesis PqqD family chaperone [Amycolatopsis]MBB1152650.1 lasso peptide biosynthesis PqqD family chaperone [Amycolatopsis dendrobii]UKD52169.1 lasso peptide biosynthesis PqqD family chaperone [Amycolatopsis sp. FU40]
MHLHPDTALTDTPDGSVLLNKRTGRYWQVNRTGTHTLDRLLAGETADQIAADLAARYDIDAAQVQADITAMTESLLAAGLVEPS